MWFCIFALFISRIKNFFPFFTRRLLWSLPKNQPIVILDEAASQYLIPSLGSADYFILKKRSTIYIKYLLAAFFIDMKINFRDLSYFYNARMLDRLSPILVITCIDNCPLYWRLDKERKKGNFLTVQNGTHYVNMPPDIPERYHHVYLEGIPYYSNFACISAFEIDYYSKNSITVENYHPIGSIQTSQHMESFSKKSKTIEKI